MRPEVLTGSEGFIGKHLFEHLKSKYGPILCLDIINKQDITKDLEFPRDIGCVYHLAAIASVPVCEKFPKLAMATNAGGTRNVLEAAKASELITFILASSAAVYGDKNHICTEEDSLKPLGVYGKSKVEAEEIVMNTPQNVCLRLFNVYGPNGKGVVNKFIDRALKGLPLEITGDGKQTRDFVYVDDVCEAFLCARQSEGIYNIGSGTHVTMNELAEMVIAACESDSKIKYVQSVAGDIRFSCADISKAGDELGWSPMVDLEEGIRSIAKWKTQSSSELAK